MGITVKVNERDLKLKAATNEKAHWKFEAGNWKCSFRGSYHQACVVARNVYSKAFRTSYGELLVVDAVMLEESKQIGFKF